MFIHSAELFHAKRTAATLTLALLAAAGLPIAADLACADGYPSKFSFGETASEQDIAKIAIAIPADGKGLPPGRGDSATGKQVYETACAACHGADLKGVAGLPDMPSGAALRLVGGRGLSITHNFCSSDGTQPDVGEA